MKKLSTAIVAAAWFAVVGGAPASPETLLTDGYAMARGWLARFWWSRPIP